MFRLIPGIPLVATSVSTELELDTLICLSTLSITTDKERVTVKPTGEQQLMQINLTQTLNSQESITIEIIYYLGELLTNGS